ncbi:MAG TPA: hypothetical protein PLF40_16010 [Kofleriaceae bacterium]|nr:hypothetical protein [Kofleriaceae bacterium]
MASAIQGACVAILLLAGFYRLYQLRFVRARLPPAGETKERAEKVRRMLKHLTRKTINQLVEGEAAVVVGHAFPVAGAPPLVSLLQQQPCLAFHAEQRTADALLREDAACGDFLLRDATGTVLVRGAQLEFAVAVGPWFQRTVIGHDGVFVVHREALLLPGAEVAVCGAVVMRALAADDYRESTHQMEIVATPTFPAVASTDDDITVPPEVPIAPQDVPRGRQ